MTLIERGAVIDIDLNPVKGSETGKVRPCIVVTNDVYNQRIPIVQVVTITSFTEKKAQISTNVIIEPSSENGLIKQLIADCLQTRPVVYQYRLIKNRGHLSKEKLVEIDNTLKLVFDLK